MFGFIYAKLALVQDQLSIAVCPEAIVGVEVVNEQVVGGATVSTHVHVAVDWLLLTIILKMQVHGAVGIAEVVPLY